jgi:hypothetical protein
VEGNVGKEKVTSLPRGQPVCLTDARSDASEFVAYGVNGGVDQRFAVGCGDQSQDTVEHGSPLEWQEGPGQGKRRRAARPIAGTTSPSVKASRPAADTLGYRQRRQTDSKGADAPVAKPGQGP